jgi:cytoskeletal protein CcmA (bactofilin family)
LDDSGAAHYGRRTAMAEPNSTKNVLARDVEIKGAVRFQGELVCDGKIEGEVNSPGKLTLGENAEVRGEIHVGSVSLYGKVFGNITVTERCDLKSNAQLIGDLKAPRLSIEEGATFAGKSEVTPHKAAFKPEVVRRETA